MNLALSGAQRFHHLLYGVRGAGKEGPQRDPGDTLSELGVFPRGTLPALDFRGCKKRTEQREAEEEGRTSSARSRHLQRSEGPSCHPALPWVAWITMWEAVLTPHSWTLSGGPAIREVLLNGDVNVSKHLSSKTREAVANGILWVEVRDTAVCPSEHRTKASSPQCQVW